jgi:hypothetical protein
MIRFVTSLGYQNSISNDSGLKSFVGVKSIGRSRRDKIKKKKIN